MKRVKMLKAGMFSLACLGMVLPIPVLQAAVAAKPDGREITEGASACVDVALRRGGVLLGQVVDVNGTPAVGVRVSLCQMDRQIAATVTDQSGYFLLGGLRGGTYEIVAGEARGTYRVWAPNTAPPSAQPGALVVAGGNPVRGQQGPLGYWLGNPWVVAGLVAAAVAVPVAIHNHRIHRTTSP